MKVVKSVRLTDSLTMSELKNGYWLYDETRGMNLSMKAKTQEQAFIEAITYYQKRCTEIEDKKKSLYDSVNNFIKSLSDNDEVYIPCDCNENYY